MLIIVHHLVLTIVRKTFLILGKGPTFGINGSAPEKKFDFNVSKVNTQFCLSLHYNCDNSYLFVNEKKSLN